MDVVRSCPTLWTNDNVLHHSDSLQIKVMSNNEIFPCEVWNCPYNLQRDPILPACICGFKINKRKEDKDEQNT